MTALRINNIDRLVGKRIRALRRSRKISQTDLANAAGVRFQQIQKYESGVNRVSASRLWAIAETLGVDIVYFFDGLNAEEISETEAGSELEPLAFLRDPEAIEILTLLKGLPPGKKTAVLSIVRSMAM